MTALPCNNSMWRKDQEEPCVREKRSMSWVNSVLRQFLTNGPSFLYFSGDILIGSWFQDSLSSKSIIYWPLTSELLFPVPDVYHAILPFPWALTSTIDYFLFYMSGKINERWVQRCDPINSHSLSSLLLFPFPTCKTAGNDQRANHSLVCHLVFFCIISTSLLYSLSYSYWHWDSFSVTSIYLFSFILFSFTNYFLF